MLSAQPLHWFALMVTVNRERWVAAILRNKGFEEYVPTYKVVRQWSDRRKVLRLPLFPGYVFCRFSENQKVMLLTTPRLIRIVGVGRSPLPIDESELQAVRTMVNSKLPVCPWPFLKTGNLVRVERGALCGLQGIFVRRRRDRHVIVSLPLLRRSVAVEVKEEDIKPIGGKISKLGQTHDGRRIGYAYI